LISKSPFAKWAILFKPKLQLIVQFLLLSTTLIAILAIYLGRKIKKLRLESQSKNAKKLRFSSLPIHYIYCFVLWSFIVAAALILTPVSLATKSVIFTVIAVIIFFLSRLAFEKKFNSPVSEF
jgi:DMSO reductase anchor subunit